MPKLQITDTFSGETIVHRLSLGITSVYISWCLQDFLSFYSTLASQEHAIESECEERRSPMICFIRFLLNKGDGFYRRTNVMTKCSLYGVWLKRWQLTWWRHQMETFFALLALCVGNSPVTGEFPSQRPVTRSFDVFFDLRMNKRLRKQSRRRWIEIPLHSLWRHSK